MILSLLASICRLRRALLAAVLLGPAGLHAQSVPFTFSGNGSGGSLVISWSTSVSFTIGTAPNVSNNYPIFVIENTGNLLGGTNQTAAISSTATFSRTSPNPSGPFTPSDLGSGFTGASGTNPVAPTDTYIFAGFGNPTTGVGAAMAIGDVFVLSAGSVTLSSFTGTVPSSGSYAMFLGDTNGLNLGAASAIPEPSTYAAIAGAVALGAAAWRRRSRQPDAA